MSGIASNPVAPPCHMRHSAARPRSEAKRFRIIDAAMQHFAENGYPAARVGDIAATPGIAKGSIFQHFGSKDGPFLEVYKRAVRSFPKCLHAPADARIAGFFEGLYDWLVRTEDLLREDWIPYRIMRLGNYGTDFSVEARNQSLSQRRRSPRYRRLCPLWHRARRIAQGHGMLK
jgi:AcrR family transcriptional regulator